MHTMSIVRETSAMSSAVRSGKAERSLNRWSFNLSTLEY